MIARGVARLVAVAAIMIAGAGCGGRGAPPASPIAPPATVTERMLAMLPQGAQVVVELDLARLRGNPVIGAVVTRALAERSADLPAGVPASPLAVADHVVLAAYGVGTAQAAVLTMIAAPARPDAAPWPELAETTKITDEVYAFGPPDWVEQVQQRVAFANTGEAKFAIAAPADLLALRKRAMPEQAPGAVLRVTARLSFDARVALARQTGLDTAPAQLSAWADVVDDAALIVDCDAEARDVRDGMRRLEATLRGALSAFAELPEIRALGLGASLGAARLTARGGWVRTVIAIGPTHLQRAVARAQALLPPPPP